MMVVLAVLPVLAATAGPPVPSTPPRTIAFQRGYATDLTDPPPVPQYGYFTNRSLPGEWPEAGNLGAFTCSRREGTATYLLGGTSFHRDLTYRGVRRSEQGTLFYTYEEPVVNEHRITWGFEAQPNAQGNHAIYYQVDDGDVRLFQVASKARLASTSP